MRAMVIRAHPVSACLFKTTVGHPGFPDPFTKDLDARVYSHVGWHSGLYMAKITVEPLSEQIAEQYLGDRPEVLNVIATAPGGVYPDTAFLGIVSVQTGSAYVK